MRLDVKKTYKLFIGGQFPRSESGRSYGITSPKGIFLANAAQASRKDLRDAVTAARSAFSNWSQATAFNRGQILYRIAEIMEGRREQFIAEIVACEGVNAKKASEQVDAAIDLWVWYAGWCDKYVAVAGSQNPIAGPFYNFTTPEALGVIGAIADQKSSLVGLVQSVAPIITSGNSALIIANEKSPLSAITMSEVLATSDLHAGVVNILTGKVAELAPWMASHMDIDGIDLSGASRKSIAELKTLAADNLKRCHHFTGESLERILTFTESKTVWHPIGV